MNIKLLFLSLIMSACGATTVPQEEYDHITIASYKNIYDNENKLLETKRTDILYIYEHGVNIIKKVDENSTTRYKYTKDNGVITETNFVILDEIEIFKQIKNTEETLRIDGNKDTTRYSLLRYFDDSRTKLAYIRKIDLKTVTRDGMTNDNYEEGYFYNKNGIEMTKVRYDFNTKKKFITYQFDKLPYNEAIRLIPRTTDEHEIVCYTQRIDKDTVIDQTSINGIPTMIEKTIVGKGKKQILCFNSKMELVNSTTELENDGVTVKIYSSAIENWTDSAYYEKGKKVRQVNISDLFESVTTFKYDKKGNIIEEVDKTKDLDNRTNEEVINEMLEILRKSKVKKAE